MKTIEDLRAALFETLQAVKGGQLEIDRAKAVGDLAQTIINTAKVEADYARATGADVRSGFITSPAAQRLTGTGPKIPSLASQMEAAGRSKA